MQEAFTFEDILIQPKYSSIESRKTLSTKTRLTNNISINTPIISANMDTITESDMAIKMAQLGGAGVIHRFLDINTQCNEVKKVKRSHNFLINDPYSIDEEKTLLNALEYMNKNRVNFLLTHRDNLITGSISRKQILMMDDKLVKIKSIKKDFSQHVVIELFQELTEKELKSAFASMQDSKILLMKDKSFAGLVCRKDVELRMKYKLASIDKNNTLLVGAAIGVKNDYLERAQELIKSGVNFLVIDIAHGHSILMENAIKNIRKISDIDIIAGNIATKDGYKFLEQLDVNAIKIGIGSGATCATRVVAGIGYPQLSALDEIQKYSKYYSDYNIPMIADGGIKTSGDIFKCFAFGSESVMLGSLLSGTKETPGEVKILNGKKVKEYRGMASKSAAYNRQFTEKDYTMEDNYTAEGVSTTVDYKGNVEDIIMNLSGGIKSGMSYVNALSILEIEGKSEKIKITNAGWNESKPHILEK